MHVPLTSDRVNRKRHHPTYWGRDRSNYTVVFNPETCKACALCIKRYPMDALQLKHSPLATNRYAKAVTVDTEISLDCGVCVHTGSTQYLTLKRREKTLEPPKDFRDCMQSYMADHFHFHLVLRWPEESWSNWQGEFDFRRYG